MKNMTTSENLVDLVHQHTIGGDLTFLGPFGYRRCIYLDHTASGKPLRGIENFIQQNVLPTYANTHTTIAYTAAETTAYRHEAREIVRESVGASKDDVVIFCGSGCTAAVHKLVHAVQEQGQHFGDTPIVFVGPFEHHSNLLPWRDSGAQIINIPSDAYGFLDVNALESQLKKHSSKKANANRLLIGVFSVCSNVTGVLTDDVKVTVLMHQYGGLAFWDYASAASHFKVEMNPKVESNERIQNMARKDALFFSGHKLMGGPQTPGVLVAKKHVFRNRIPGQGGGGTVFFVTPEKHEYLQDIVDREEGGTPAIIESIRLGLVFRLKDSIGTSNIVLREAFLTKRVLSKFSQCPNLKILGNKSAPRGPIISFMIEHEESGYFLHHNFVVAVLNDLFGIQCRGSCMCAGPYSQILLGINLKKAHQYENLLNQDRRVYHKYQTAKNEPEYDLIFKPGFTRVSIPYDARLNEIDFIAEAITIVANEGWKLLPLYSFHPEHGDFHHYLMNTKNRGNKLKAFNLASGYLPKEQAKFATFEECLYQSRHLIANTRTLLKSMPLKPDDSLKFNPDFAILRWFLLPSEALMCLLDPKTAHAIQSPKPFTPVEYKEMKPKLLKWTDGSIPHQLLENSNWLQTQSEDKLIEKLIFHSDDNKLLDYSEDMFNMNEEVDKDNKIRRSSSHTSSIYKPKLSKSSSNLMLPVYSTGKRRASMSGYDSQTDSASSGFISTKSKDQYINVEQFEDDELMERFEKLLKSQISTIANVLIRQLRREIQSEDFANNNNSLAINREMSPSSMHKSESDLNSSFRTSTQDLKAMLKENKTNGIYVKKSSYK